VAGRIKNSCQERKIDVKLGPPKISAEIPSRPRDILHEKQLYFTWEHEHAFQVTFFGRTLRQSTDDLLESLAAPRAVSTEAPEPPPAAAAETVASESRKEKTPAAQGLAQAPETAAAPPLREDCAGPGLLGEPQDA
jgi:hypothetical protein